MVVSDKCKLFDIFGDANEDIVEIYYQSKNSLLFSDFVIEKVTKS